MQHILVLGSGRSSFALIDYLQRLVLERDWKLTVGDYLLANAESKLLNHANISAVSINATNPDELDKYIPQADIVISMLPASFHIHVAKGCIQHKKHLLTASYVSEEIKKLDKVAVELGLLLLMESGLDPGIDHMSAMNIINKYRQDGYELLNFETFTGGLIAPESEGDNPWKYKFTWNPRNVVIAGQGSVKFIQEGKYKFIPYHKIFRRTEIVSIPGYGLFEGYANRDSLKYRTVYDLENINTLYRGTFRRPGFCRAWDIFVQLGATDDSYRMESVHTMTHRDFINSFLSYNPRDSVELKLAHYLNLDLDGQEMYKLKWLGLFEDTPVGLTQGTPAQILEHILKKKWAIESEDNDMIVMWHKFDFKKETETKSIHSHMVVKGEGAENTAMSKTVGLPLGIAAKLLLENKITATGVRIPIIQEIYEPILKGLAEQNIRIVDTVQNPTYR